MGDLKNQQLIVFKGWMFLLSGMLSGILLLMEVPTMKAAILLTIAVWSFCRFYYFAFYVVQHYVDGDYRFAGLWDFVCWSVRGGRSGAGE